MVVFVVVVVVFEAVADLIGIPKSVLILVIVSSNVAVPFKIP